MGEMSELCLGFSANDMFCRDLDAALHGKPFVSEDTDYSDSLPLLPSVSSVFEVTDTQISNRRGVSTTDFKKGKGNKIMSIWDKFDKEIDTEGLAKDVQEAAENSGNYREVPYDTYEVSIEKLELGESKKGDPMFICWMKILEGEYKNSLIFMNQVVTQGFQIHIANVFLRSLVTEAEKDFDIQFKTYNQYGNMIMDIAEAIEDNFEYAVEYSENSKGYPQFKITDVYVLED